ncbi:hypothetical protein OZ664_10820 [Elizabethkingia sp. HX WHF]|uniref:hypothetical protein n=1 Tax=Elizabethkingia TaxID=308865 RepID=UPI0009990B38|nr:MULTISPECIES: hypothetical protein [Elizabethkingia]ATL43439.1 hypothetical protein CQS02_09065 [Elizabethkingia miricola]MCL1638477.1 hypothetical protein [Elizabethkingia bruuniana]MDX8564494.1 hypothetical protein [Elizabethkingia sp. HX WHF]OPC26283.1 hypothetical protein BAY00_02965 [Elizabethkingia bruuniana]
MKKQLAHLQESSLKKEYLPPSIEVDEVELEQGIAAGSAVVAPTTVDGDVSQQWDTDTDTTGTYNW